MAAQKVHLLIDFEPRVSLQLQGPEWTHCAPHIIVPNRGLPGARHSRPREQLSAPSRVTIALSLLFSCSLAVVLWLRIRRVLDRQQEHFPSMHRHEIADDIEVLCRRAMGGAHAHARRGTAVRDTLTQDTMLSSLNGGAAMGSRGRHPARGTSCCPSSRLPRGRRGRLGVPRLPALPRHPARPSSFSFSS